MQPQRHHAGNDLHFLRRQIQLVGVLRPLGISIVRARQSKILNGGRDKWKAEGREMTREVPKYARTNYPVPKRRYDKDIRAFADEALAQSKAKKPLIDVRSPGEYKGEITHMPEYPQEGVLRGGHIPGAKSVPWKTAVKDDGTFKAAEELRKIYSENCGLKKDDDIIAYCRIGERSSHTWF